MFEILSRWIHPKKLLTNDERFDHAVNLVLSHEGGYVNDRNDRGGETKYGISKRSYPNVDIPSLTRDMAKNIYRQDFWEKENYASIEDLDLATKLLDIAVNIGAHRANLMLQQALMAVGTKNVEEDSVIGPLSLIAINSANPLSLIAAFKAEAAGYYKTLAKTTYADKKFLKGWLDRAYA